MIYHYNKNKSGVYIGRPKSGGEWGFGNPFVIGKDGTRTEVIEKFKNWLDTPAKNPHPDATWQRRKWILDNLYKIKNEDLICWCDYPKEDCHGRVLVDKANNQLFYTGVGARITPESVLGRFRKLSAYLDKKGYVLRSGSADGADSAFEDSSNSKQIFLPWKRYNGNDSDFYNFPSEIDAKCHELAGSVHPYWESLKDSVKKLHARNVYQILGPKLDNPSQFLVCWTENGEVKGGTATAIRLAEKFHVPVFNFGRPGDDEKLWQFIK